MKAMPVFLIAVFCFASIGWIWQDPVSNKDKEARRLCSEGNIDEALSKWRDAQIESPEKKELHYNIGNALHGQKKYEDAFNEYGKALDSKDAELQAKTHYNMGNTDYRMGKLSEAIEDYEKCLAINPDDEDAKYNIEFIRKKIKENLEKQESKQGEQNKQKSQESQAQQQEANKNEAQKQEEEAKSETKEGEEKDAMTKEDALRLLDAIKDDEKDLQKELRTQPGEGRYRVEKDW